MIHFLCPGCSRTFEVADNLGGRIGSCPGCKSRFEIPRPEVLAEPEPPNGPSPRRVTAETSGNEDRDPVRRNRETDEDEDDPPRRKRSTEDDDDERPRSKRRPSDDDDDERPRSKRRSADDDDDERPRRKRSFNDDDDYDLPPRPSSKKKKKKVKRWSSSRDGGERSWGNPIAKIALGAGVFGLVCAGLALIWPLLVILPIGIGVVMSMIGATGMLIIAFQDDVMQGILCLLVPGYSLYYLITHFEESKSAFFLYIGGLALMMVAGCGFLAVFGPIFKTPDPVQPPPRRVELRLTAPLTPLAVFV